MKNIVVLGSTGSIGVSALEVIENLGQNYKLIGISANSNAKLLLKQAIKYKPKWISLVNEQAALKIKNNIPKNIVFLPPGIESMMEMASHPSIDLIVNALSGGIGFAPLVAAIKAGKTIALANKEPMVMAGVSLMKECHRWNAKIIPVDSEPSAIFQCFEGSIMSLSKVFLTASGGPFFKHKGSLENVTPKQALKHPKWKMGAKITIDSATLMNKGFEAIEISNMFSIPLSKIDVVIHPQSIIHSAVEYRDGSVLAQMSLPDMKLPIQYAITYPERKISLVKPVDFFSTRKLEFYKPDFKKFPCLDIAFSAAKKGGTYPACLSAADEVAVEAFLKGKIGFMDIPRLVEKVLSMHSSGLHSPSLALAVEAEQWGRSKAEELLLSKRYVGKKLKRIGRKT